MTRHPPPEQRIVCILSPGGFEHAGGIGRWVEYLCNAWPEIPDAPALQMIDTRGFGGVWVGVTTFLAALVQLVRLWRQGRLGLVHINLSADGSTVRKCLVSMLAGWADVPTIVQLHSGRYPNFYERLPRWAKARVRRMFARAARVVVLGQVWARFVTAELGVEEQQVVIMPNAVRPPPPSPLRPPRDTCHIVMLGRLGPPKGIPELLEALAMPAMRDLDWRITLAGDGDQAPWRAACAGFADRVDMPGWLDGHGVAALLADADVFVLPSRSENMPVSLIEALAARVAVVTTAVGAVPEIVEDGVSALVVPIQDPAALAEALARLVASPELRARIAAGGDAVFREKLDIRKSAARLATLYDMVMAGSRLRSLAR